MKEVIPSRDMRRYTHMLTFVFGTLEEFFSLPMTYQELFIYSQEFL